eukprot:4287426-Pyramimonas_sp.AAC.1
MVVLAAVNAFYDCGNTFEGSNGASQIAYARVLDRAAALVCRAKTRRGSAQVYASGARPHP